MTEDELCPGCSSSDIHLNIGGQEYYCRDCDWQWGRPSTPVSIPIPLPPEPPRDRVIEAVDADGKVQMSWTWDSEREYWCSGIYPYGFDDVVASGIENRCMGWSLRHVAAEGGKP